MSDELSQSNESWHKVHAQLLKSVADAQAKLLAGINELADTKMNALVGRLDSILAWHATQAQLLKDVSGRIGALRDMALLHDSMLVEIRAALLAPPRRQVERLRTKRIAPQRKQRR